MVAGGRCLAHNDGQPVLVVDDDDIILSTVEILLLDEGYAVTLASNGQEALACVERKPPCLILWI